MNEPPSMVIRAKAEMKCLLSDEVLSSLPCPEAFLWKATFQIKGEASVPTPAPCPLKAAALPVLICDTGLRVLSLSPCWTLWAPQPCWSILRIGTRWGDHPCSAQQAVWGPLRLWKHLERCLGMGSCSGVPGTVTEHPLWAAGTGSSPALYQI